MLFGSESLAGLQGLAGALTVFLGAALGFVEEAANDRDFDTGFTISICDSEVSVVSAIGFFLGLPLFLFFGFGGL